MLNLNIDRPTSYRYKLSASIFFWFFNFLTLKFISFNIFYKYYVVTNCVNRGPELNFISKNKLKFSLYTLFFQTVLKIHYKYKTTVYCSNCLLNDKRYAQKVWSKDLVMFCLYRNINEFLNSIWQHRIRSVKTADLAKYWNFFFIWYELSALY